MVSKIRKECVDVEYIPWLYKVREMKFFIIRNELRWVYCLHQAYLELAESKIGYTLCLHDVGEIPRMRQALFRKFYFFALVTYDL